MQEAVSYTHLDVYKRQTGVIGGRRNEKRYQRIDIEGTDAGNERFEREIAHQETEDQSSGQKPAAAAVTFG